MGRSVSASGAIAALELLPKAVTLPEGGVPLRVDCGAEPGADLAQRIAATTVQGAAHGFALAEVMHRAVIQPGGAGDNSPDLDLVAGRLPEGLGKLLVRVVDEGCENGACAYAIALCLAAMLENVAAHAALTLIEGPLAEHPAVTALGGYLLFQLGETDRGRRALSRAAMAARRVPEFRSVLQFTQHVLLVQQFGG